MNNYKNKAWSIFAGIIFAFTTLVTVGLLVKVAGLNMLPGKYFGLAVFAVVFLLLIIFLSCRLYPRLRFIPRAVNSNVCYFMDKSFN